MQFIEQLTANVRDQGLALGKMIVTTEPTEQQTKAKEVLGRFYGIMCNVFFLGIIATFVVYVLLQFAGDHPALLPAGKALGEKLSYPALAGVVLLIIALFLLLLRAMLHLFQYISAIELVKFYLFIELINLARQYLGESTVQPVPFLFAMLKKIFGLPD